MNFLEERIVKDGVVKEGNILKVDSFLNHQMDINLFDQMGEEFKRRFADKPINKIVTIEASGIGIACIVARHFGVPVVFAKKTQSVNIDGEVYVAEVESFTHKCKNQVIVSKKFLGPDDHVLVIDDFLANGCALQGLISIVAQAGGTVEGIGIAVEKGFQQGVARSGEADKSPTKRHLPPLWQRVPDHCRHRLSGSGRIGAESLAHPSRHHEGDERKDTTSPFQRAEYRKGTPGTGVSAAHAGGRNKADVRMVNDAVGW